jgi:hypothetical protein
MHVDVRLSVCLSRSTSSELIVTVIQARDLECDHVTGSLDSYACVTLYYRTATIKRQTKVELPNKKSLSTESCREFFNYAKLHDKSNDFDGGSF